MIKQNLPRHVAILVDGNRRWAKKHGLPEIAGHQKVTDEVLDAIIFHCLELGIPYITFWAFSTENWRRGPKFYNALFNLLRQALKKNLKKYLAAGIKLNVIGNLSRIPSDLTKNILAWIQKSKTNTKATVTIALNYGGRDEIIRAIKKMIKDHLKHLRGGRMDSSEVKLTEEQFSNYLDTADMPDPDLIIRTGGSQRLSGFLSWQSAYSELYFTNVLMPDFTVKEFNKALEEYKRRQRRFGK